MIHCQDPSNLPPPLAHHLRHYAAMSAREAKGKCHMVCDSIRRWFPHLTIVVGAVEWSGSPTVHCWLEHHGRVIDPTRQQFGAWPVVFWRAKKQDLTAMGFYRQVGDYMAAHPEAKRKEILAAVADVVYRDDGLHPVKAFKADCSAIVEGL